MRSMSHVTPQTEPLFQLTEKVSLVTGAAGKLGREMSLALAERGAHVVLVGRTQRTLEALKSDCEQLASGEILVVPADATAGQQVDQVFESVQKHFGRLDVLVNNVTGNAKGLPETMPESTFSTALHGIVTGMFLCSQAAARIMIPQRSGSIINMASIYGMVAADQRMYGDSGLNSSAVYATGKGAVIQLTRYLAMSWAPHGIRVNTLSPGGVEDVSNDHPVFRKQYTERTPMARMMRREEIRGPLIFLASAASSYVTGQNLVVDGGFTSV